MIAKLIKVIETDLTLKGDGKKTPIRRIIQYWSLEGKLLAEVDCLKQSEAENHGRKNK